MTERALPDCEAIAVGYLLTRSAVTDVFGTRIGTRLGPDGKTQRPFLRLRRISSTAPVRRHLRAANTQLEAWGPPTLAQDGLELAVAALHADDFPGVYPNLGVVSGVDDGFGPRDQPDPATDEPRWLASIIIYAHPIPAE